EFWLSPRPCSLAGSLGMFETPHPASPLPPLPGQFGILDSQWTLTDGLVANRHLLFLLSTLRYTFAAIKFNTSSTGARFSYRLAFISAAVTYGIVVFKAYKARAARGTGLQPQALLADENVQYLSKFSWPFFMRG